MSKIVKHHYTACGLPNVWIRCRRLIDDAGQEVFIIAQINRLHKCIAQEILMSKNSMTGAELKFLRSEMGMTPDEFGELVLRTGATISRWERKECAMDGAMEALVRMRASTKLGLKKLIRKRLPESAHRLINLKVKLV